MAILTSEFAPYRGGVATYVKELANAATTLGHDITVFAPDYLDSGIDIAEAGFEVRPFRAGPFSARWYPSYFRTARCAVRGAFDRIFAADIPFVEVLALTRPFHRRAFDAAVHGSEVLRARTSVKGRVLRPARIFAAPDRIFANSAYTRRLLLDLHPYLRRERVVLAPLGVAERCFAPADTERLRIRLGLGDLRVIACVGRITPRKGQLTLLRALARTALDPSPLAVVFAGRAAERDRAYRDSLRAAAETVHPVKVVLAEDLGDDDVRALYGASEIFCLPGAAETAAVEGFGLVILEAAAQGTPAVAGAVGGVPEVIRHEETGLLVPPDDPVALGSALAALLEDEAKRHGMGEAARRTARDFTWRRCARITFGDSDGNA